MQLLSNKLAYIEDPYADMKYQIEEYRKCIAKLSFYSTVFPPYFRISYFRFSYFRIFEFNLTYATENYTDPTDEYFHCYRSPPLSTGRLHHEPYILHSLYVHQVRNWLRYFPQEQLLFIKSEGIRFFLFYYYYFYLLLFDNEKICTRTRKRR
jgi:hypothetical protein